MLGSQVFALYFFHTWYKQMYNNRKKLFWSTEVSTILKIPRYLKIREIYFSCWQYMRVKFTHYIFHVVKAVIAWIFYWLHAETFEFFSFITTANYPAEECKPWSYVYIFAIVFYGNCKESSEATFSDFTGLHKSK